MFTYLHMRSLRRYIRSGYACVCAVNNVEVASTAIKTPSRARFYILRTQYHYSGALTRYTKNYKEKYMDFASPSYSYMFKGGCMYFLDKNTRIYNADRYEYTFGNVLNICIKSDYVNTA